jgi:hypothetical protein
MLWLNNLAYTYFGNYPLIVYIGITTYLLLLVTALIPRMNRWGWTKIPIKYHIRLAYVTAVLATSHGLMAIAGYIG